MSAPSPTALADAVGDGAGALVGGKILLDENSLQQHFLRRAEGGERGDPPRLEISQAQPHRDDRRRIAVGGFRAKQPSDFRIRLIARDPPGLWALRPVQARLVAGPP